MEAIFSKIFRSINAQLIYENNWLLEKLLKVNLNLSKKFYKSWVKKNRPEKFLTLTDIDKDIIMKVDVSKVMGAAFYWMGVHELKEWRFLNRFLTPEMTFIDVGANQGEYSLFSAKRLAKGKVFAFEPVDIFYSLLAENVRSNKFHNVEAFHFGLSDQNTSLPIYTTVSSAGENEGLASIFQSEEREQFIQHVELRTLDEMVPSLHLSRIDFIKIDVEGAELNVLQGARHTIDKFRPHVLLEMNEPTFTAAGYSQSDVIQFFQERNYSLNRLGKRAQLKEVSQLPSFCNVIFAPR